MIKHVVIIGAGFAGLEAAKVLGNRKDLQVTLLDRRNHHLFQPLLYQVSMAGLSPAEIASPIRSILRNYRNIDVIMTQVESIDPVSKVVKAEHGNFSYDWLIVASGSKHSYFGHDDWEIFAPGLKNIEQATEIRRRVFRAFEMAERGSDAAQKRRDQTFVVVGGGPTGVELAGALGEITRFTLTRDFRHINPASTRIILIEAGPRILPSFAEKLSRRATRDLESLGVQVWTNARVSKITAEGVQIGAEFLESSTVLWAAGVAASPLGKSLDTELDQQGRVLVNATLNPAKHPQIFVVGDCAHCKDERGGVLPGLAPVAMQQGRAAASNILADLAGNPRTQFQYIDKGMMATIGRSRAVMEFRGIKLAGIPAWLFWMVIHIWYLVGFRNKLLVYVQWVLSFLSYKRGARLITETSWTLQKT